MGKSKLPTDAAGRLGLGKQLHEKHWQTVKGAAASLGIPEYQLYVVLKEYRDSAGIVTASQIAASRRRAERAPAPVDEATERKRAKDRRYREKLRAERMAPPANGSNGQLVRMPAGQDVAIYQNRIADLEDQLSHALDECQTLQKLLMVVGRTL